MARDPFFVLDITNHGSSFPKYAANSEYDVTGNSYSKKGELSKKGMQEMYKLGQEFRAEYVDKQHFLSQSYDPTSIYLHSSVDQSSLMSAYAFILGVYPENISYLNLNMNNALEHEKLVRKTLGLSETPAPRANSKVSVATKEGFLFWSDPSSQCPGVYQRVQSKLNSASDSLNDEYQTKLYPELATAFNRTEDKFTFPNTHYYLEDYLAAKNLDSEYPKFRSQKVTEQLISEYEKDYYYDGILGGNELSRVIAHPLLSYMIINSFGKGEILRGNLQNRPLEKLKHSHFFTDDITFAAFLKAIGYPQGTAPSGADNIRFEVFETNKKHYVRATLNGKPINFSEAEHGIFELDTFLKVLYPMMYFGDVDAVCKGREDISLNVYPKCQNYQEYLMEQFKSTKQVVTHAIIPKCRMREKVIPVPVVRAERTIEHKVDLINIGYVEIVQVPAPIVRYDTRIVEVDKPVPVVQIREVEKLVPVIEEKIVVHEVEKVVVQEVEKIVTEQPTHIHHIVIDTPDKPSAIPPIFFEEEAAFGWPWWLWLLPLLCLIPCIALCCCLKRKPAAKPRPKNPMAPVIAKPLARPKEKEIMHIQTEERHSPERKFVIEKKVVDEGDEIEMEITRELQKSRVMRESRSARAVSHGRQTAAEIAGESVLDRGSGGGRRRRIKTIKKFGQVIGREEQILDEDGNVIKSERIGMDENEAASDHHLKSETNVNYVSSYSGGNQHVVGGDGTDHYFKESYDRESHMAPVVGSTTFVNERSSNRGYSSGRHLDTQHRVGGGLEYEQTNNYGRFSPGGRGYSHEGGRYSSGGGRFSDGGHRYSVGGTRYSNDLEDNRGNRGGYSNTYVKESRGYSSGSGNFRGGRNMAGGANYQEDGTFGADGNFGTGASAGIGRNGGGYSSTNVKVSRGYSSGGGNIGGGGNFSGEGNYDGGANAGISSGMRGNYSPNGSRLERVERNVSKNSRDRGGVTTTKTVTQSRSGGTYGANKNFREYDDDEFDDI